MWHKIKYLSIGLVLIACTHTPAAAQTPLCPTEGIVNQGKLADLVDCLADGLVTVWEDEIKSGIQLAYPKVVVLKNVPLEHDETCNWRPEQRQRAGKPYLRYSKTLIYYSMALQQAQVFYLLGIDPVDQPAAIFSYFDQSLLPVMRDDVSKCRRSGPNLRGYPYYAVPTILNGKVSQSKYADIVGRLRRSPVADKLQAYVGSFPMFFAILHEAGHVVLHSSSELDLPIHEPEADEFARRVSEANELPVVLGLGHFQLFYGNNRNRHNASMACRLVTLAENGPTPRSFEVEFGSDVWRRAELLREAYISHYSKRCNMPQ